MFDLERETKAWARTVHADRCRGSASESELLDHLYCEIDLARTQGLDDEHAFVAAVAKLGSSGALRAEHAKNRSFLGMVCAFAARLEGRESSAGARSLLAAHGVVWATLMISLSLVLTRYLSRNTTCWVLLGILVPLWWASEQVLRRAIRSRSGGSAR